MLIGGMNDKIKPIIVAMIGVCVFRFAKMKVRTVAITIHTAIICPKKLVLNAIIIIFLIAITLYLTDTIIRLHIPLMVNTHTGDREHVFYPRIGLGSFLP